MTEERRKRPRVLVISNVAWDRLWQRHQSLATMLARRNDVYYCEVPGMRRVGVRDLLRVMARAGVLFRRRGSNGTVAGPGERVRILRPVVFPPGGGLFQQLNRLSSARFANRRLSRMQFDLVITYTAARFATNLISCLHFDKLVYDCTDHFSAVHGIPEYFGEDEEALVARADVTVVSSEFLWAKHQARARKIALVRHGCLVDRFLPEHRKRKQPAGRTTLLYYGHIHRQHLDCDLIAKCAEMRPEWEVILVGPVITEYDFPANVRRVGHCAHEDLRSWINRADAIILPYRINGYTEAVFPAKSYECLATGLPVISTPLPELQRVFGGLIRFADRAESFVEAIEMALRADSPEDEERRIELAKANSWEERYNEFIDAIGLNEGGE